MIYHEKTILYRISTYVEKLMGMRNNLEKKNTHKNYKNSKPKIVPRSLNIAIDYYNKTRRSRDEEAGRDRRLAEFVLALAL